MTQKEKTKLFIQNRALLKNRIKHYSSIYNVDYFQIESRALEIFCEICNTYNKNKGASFTTYLYHCLKKLSMYCKLKQYSKEVSLEYIKDYPDSSLQEKILLDQAVEELSGITKEIVQKIRTKEIVNKYNRLTIDKIMELYKMDFYTAQNVFESIKKWWNAFEVEYCVHQRIVSMTVQERNGW